ncbi:MAG TPA: S53 family peptidase [Verrucomicrobiae bacterium]|nr:S53 family peptidase [Verrucomicrobiae bacterium]
MRINPPNVCCLIASLIVSFAIPTKAQIVRIGGGLRPGFARPPLHLNLNAHDATSNYGPYSPAQIRHAYGVDTLLGASVTGAGQKIGIVDAYGDPSIQTDLNNFCNYYGIPTTTVQILGTSTSNSGWGLETALDVEWAHAMAPDATIILSVARSASLSDLLAAVDAAVNAGATVISMSWGAQESPGINAYDSHFQASGVTYVASSGDSAELAAPNEVEWPASSPFVVSVGGTTLYLDAAGNRISAGGGASSETAWSDSGGGISGVYGSVPSFQTGWQATGWRTVPDVSYVADPNTGVGVAYGRYLYEVGGTSAGAPQWAALIALANQSRTSKLSGNSDIYGVAGSAPSLNPANFFDITSGSNGTDGDDAAGTGYDLVTGLGSPMANNLVPALGSPSPDFAVSVAPGSQSVAPGVTANYTVTVGSLDGFSEDVTLSASGVPSSNVSFDSSTVTGGSGSSGLTISTTGLAAGAYTVTITGTSTSGKTHTASATLVVAPPDFSLSVTPGSRSVRRGNSTTYTVTVAGSAGFNGTVSLSVSGLPRNVRGTFNPSNVTGSGASTLTISTQNNTPRGTSTLTITGTSGSLSHSVNVSLTVN